MFRDFIGLLFPRRCPGCSRDLVRQEKVVCLTCLTDLPPTGFHRTPEDNPLFRRFAGKVPLEGATAAYYFDKSGPMKRLVQALKYKNQPRIGYYLGEDWGDQVKSNPWLSTIDALVPVPLHPSRQRERGYNQAERIAAGMGKALGIPVQIEILSRKERTQTQTRKSKAERWENVNESFVVKKQAAGHIALIDDVVTTGATLEACIRVLHEQHGEELKISILALCMARND